uniref:Histone H2A n=1 Tax=Peromyscus maniculatus bairdii TaxID=230844 RepID=A0A8C8U3T2_PERMB
MSDRSGKKKMSKLSWSARAGVIFPVSQLMHYLRKGTFKYRSVLADRLHVIEYLAVEILDLAGDAMRDTKKSRIDPRCILLAVANDEELNQLLNRVTIASGDVLPRIHPKLLAKKRGTKGKSETPFSPPPEKKGRKATKPRTFKSKPKDSNKEGTSSSTSEDGPGDGFTIPARNWLQWQAPVIPALWEKSWRTRSSRPSGDPWTDSKDSNQTK